jgi:hypothetical protein
MALEKILETRSHAGSHGGSDIPGQGQGWLVQAMGTFMELRENGYPQAIFYLP